MQISNFSINLPILCISSITNLYPSLIPKNLYVAWWIFGYFIHPYMNMLLKKSTFKRRNSTGLSKFLIFSNTLILTKCLVPCMFELTDVYYINLILIILPSCCFLFKIFPMFKTVINKTKKYICLTKLLPTMMSVWLNYINSFWLFRNCIKTCFCMRKNIDISRTIINFLVL